MVNSTNLNNAISFVLASGGDQAGDVFWHQGPKPKLVQKVTTQAMTAGQLLSQLATTPFAFEVCPTTWTGYTQTAVCLLDAALTVDRVEVLNHSDAEVNVVVDNAANPNDFLRNSTITAGRVMRYPPDGTVDPRFIVARYMFKPRTGEGDGFKDVTTTVAGDVIRVQLGRGR